MKNKSQSALSTLFFLSLGLFLIFSCTSENTPGNKAEKFLIAMSNGDMETAKLMVDDDSESVILTVENAELKINGTKTNIIIVDEETNGEKSVVKFKYGDNGKVNTIRLHNGEEDWQVTIDGDSEDIIIGKESLREVLDDIDLTVEQALALSSDAVEAGLKVAGKTLEELGKILQDASGKINLEDLDINLEDLENLDINIEGSEEDIQKAKEEMVKALKKLEEAFQEK